MRLTHEEKNALLLRDVRAARAKQSLAYFIQLIRPHFDIQWFQHGIISKLEQKGLSTARRVKFGMALPPGHAKSEYTFLFCAWLIARDPDIQIKYVTYAQGFAEDQFARLKEILKLDVYVDHFGHKVNPRRAVSDERLGKKNSANLIEFIGGTGWVQACGFGGGITGGRCDLIVIDDPFKNHEEASSPTIREKRWNEYCASVKTRYRYKRSFRILMLFTRWHLDDLVGRCQKHEPKDWEFVSIKALKEGANDDAEIEALDPRSEGEALWPDTINEEELLSEKRITPEIFNAMYQQSPVPAGGAVFKAVWFSEEEGRRFKVLPETPGVWCQSWDFRHGGKGKNTSYAVGLLLFKPHNKAVVYVVDQVRGRWSTDESLAQFDAVQERPLWSKATMRLIESKADGVTILALRRSKYTGMMPVKPGADKETRARGITPHCSAGNVLVPHQSPWLGDWLAEVTTFPAAANDDQVDALSQGVVHLLVSARPSPKISAGVATRVRR